MEKKDYEEAAAILGCEVAAIKAVAEVESSGSGFLEDGRPKILFEAHIFSRLTDHKYDKSDPDISSFSWNRSLYTKDEHKRLEKACAINRSYGLQSASWGKFQIMGFNYSLCGFSRLQDFINAMYKSEKEQLKAFCEFIKTQKLERFLKEKDWGGFALRYNGKSYKENKYDEKLEKEYRANLV